MLIEEDDRDWKPAFKAKMQQSNLWESRSTQEPPRKIPYKFRYVFECDDPHCKGHKRMIEDWEVGALFWRLVDNGVSELEAAKQVKHKFLNGICAPEKTLFSIWVTC